MVFQVPPNHPEMQRLEEAADGSLEVGAMVELANGQPAVITGVSLVWLLSAQFSCSVRDVQISKEIQLNYEGTGLCADGRRICCDRC